MKTPYCYATDAPRASVITASCEAANAKIAQAWHPATALRAMAPAVAVLTTDTTATLSWWDVPSRAVVTGNVILVNGQWMPA